MSGWEEVAHAIDPEDQEFVADYVFDLTGHAPSDLVWSLATVTVPPLGDGQEDTSRRAPGHVQRLRRPVRDGATPPVVVVDGSVVDGWHRLKAAAQEGMTAVPAWHGTPPHSP